MKNLIFFISVLSAVYANAQTTIYSQLVKALNEKGLVTDNKLIGVNFWNINNIEERQNNVAFDKTMRVYEFAKLKGGERGLVLVSVCREGWSGEAVVTFNKDGNTKLIKLDFETLKDLENLPSANIIYNQKGEVVYTNLKADAVLTSMNKLITR